MALIDPDLGGSDRHQGTGTAASLLDGMDPDVRVELLSGATRRTAAAGRLIFPPVPAWRCVGLVVEGVARGFLAAGDGRQVTVRYVRPGDVIGNVFPLGERAPLGVSAVTDCTVLELDPDTLLRVIGSDATAATLLVQVLSDRIEDLYATIAATAFGSMRERVAGHLLDLAAPDASGGLLVAAITQQQLADNVGSVREVIARCLREFRDEGLVTTAPGSITILEPVQLASLVGRWYRGVARGRVRLPGDPAID